MKSHQFTSMISFTDSTWPTLIISLFPPPHSLFSSLSYLIFHCSLAQTHPLLSFLLFCPVCSLFYTACTLSVFQTSLDFFFASLALLQFLIPACALYYVSGVFSGCFSVSMEFVCNKFSTDQRLMSGPPRKVFL